MSTEVTVGAREYFPGIGKIPFEGPESKNPLAFKYYDNISRTEEPWPKVNKLYAVSYS